MFNKQTIPICFSEVLYDISMCIYGWRRETVQASSISSPPSIVLGEAEYTMRSWSRDGWPSQNSTRVGRSRKPPLWKKQNTVQAGKTKSHKFFKRPKIGSHTYRISSQAVWAWLRTRPLVFFSLLIFLTTTLGGNISDIFNLLHMEQLWVIFSSRVVFEFGGGVFCFHLLLAAPCN